MSDSSESDDGPSRWNRHRRGNGKNNRKIVMRIEFDDSNDTSSCSESQNENEEEAVRPSARGLRGRGGGKRLISSDEDSCSSGSEIVRTVVRRGGNKRKAVIIEEDPPVDEPHTSTAVQNTPSSSGNAQVPLLGEDGFASDSSNDDLEKCPICLLSLRNQEIGKPSVCDHLFCAICIEEWSRNVRTCPIDRQAFDSIVVQRSISNREFVRLIQVEETKKAEFEDEVEEIFEDPVATELEHCQICHRPDREDVMLLCDGCNHGYHMDCLSNPLTQIPDGFWYCDNCFQSEEEDIQENLNELYEDLREMGIPETRLRVREIRQPRIPRTRQSERIRASIMARTRRSSTRITTEMDFAQPESSNNLRAATSSRSTASASRSRTTRKRRSRRRTGRQRRTYVVEYDVDNFDQKFEIKTTKRVIRKKKSSKRGKRRGRRKATVRTTGTHQRNVELQEYISQRAARESGSSLPQPRFSIFGAANDLEYFSDESENSAAGGDPEVGRGSGGGAAIQTSIRIHSFSSSRSHSRRKALIRDLDQPRQVDLLSSIMDMQDRFHNATRQNHINQVTIGPDGTLNLPSKKDGEGEKKKGDQKENKNVSPSDVNQAPMYPRGGGNNYTNTGGTSGGGGGGGGYNNRFNNQSNYRNSTGGGGGGNGGQFRSGSSGGSGNGSSGGFLFNAFRRDNNFSSDGNFLQNRLNNADNNNSNRDRFRQNQNQQQRQNQNNQNRFSGSSSLGSSNDSFNRSLGDISSSSLRDSNSNRPQTSLLFSIGPISLFDTPTKSDSVGQSSSTPSSLGPSSGLSSLSLRSGGNFLSIPAKPNDNLTTPGNFNSAPSAMPMNSGNFLSTPAKSFTTDLSAPPPSTPMSLPPPSNPLSVPPPSTPLSVPPPGTPMSLPPPSAPMSVPPPSTPISVPPLINPMSALLPSAPINYSMSNVAIPMTTGSNFLPMHQPPPPVLPVYGPMNLPALDSAPPPTVGISHQTNTNEAPMPDVAPAVPPLAPPPWNSNLFRLTSDYADSNDDEDNDSDCPNFSVYSAESFQVARSSETTSGGVASSTSKKDSNNSNRQEDEFEEKEEDLVQLGDDDEIPDALEKGNAKNAENNDGIGGNKIVPESEIYEPEFPTFEAQDDDDEENDENDNEAENDEHNENSKDNDETVKKINEQVESDENECMQSSKDESKVEEDAESMDIAETDEDSGEHTAEVEKKDNENEMASVKDDGDKESEKLEKEEEKGAEASGEEDAKIDGNTNETTDVENESEVTQDKLDELKKKAPRPRKKGILELYDDSDWEEWNIDKAELIPMPPGPEPEPKIIDEVASIDGESPTKKDDEDMQNIVEGDKGNFDEQSQQEESLNNEEEHDGEEISMTPEKLPRSPDEGGTPEIDEAKLRQLKTKKVDTGSEDDEQERSYTPCLDEKTELEEGECQENANSDSGEKGKMDETRGDVSTSVVDGMEMEMISEEDEGVLSEDHQKGYGGRGNEKNKRDEGKRSKKEQFKKISKSTKERNYRDKENRNRGRKRNNSRLRSRSRSFSRGKENRNRQRPAFRRNRRKEIERYNVRNVIGQPRTYKDRYGRDTSRPPRSRSRSRSFRRLRSKSRTRSPSPKHDRRSFSMSPTPMSPRRTSARRILSPQRRISPRRRRGFSPRRSRSRSRRRSHSIRRSSLPRRRSRSPIRLRSRSRSASVARGIRRNQRPKRRASSYSCSGSCSRSHSKLGSRSRSRSPGPKSPRRSRSKTPVRQKKLRKRSKDRKKKRSKKRVLSMSPSPARSKRGARSPERLPALARKKKKRARTKTPVIEEERWSQSPRPAQDTLSNAPNDPSWTPPLIGTNNDNLTVILKNKDAAANANRKKRDKKKKGEKRRENVSKKDKRRQRSEMRDSPVAPSKEVFASGNNILVSVSFNKENNANAPQQTTVVTLPPTREEILSRRSAERHVRRVKKSREKARRRKKIDTKPIAIIDLDRSPFQVIAQSPRDVIILTDESDREPDDDAHQHNESVNSMEMGANDRNVADMHVDDIEKTIEAQRPGMMEEEHEHFEIQQLGPKTPPDPPSTVKFSLPKGKQMKARNPLHEEQEELQEQVESEHPDDQMQMPTTNKIGPNTPPESGPCSPDAYDPFDPTKSPSLSPAHSPAPPQTNEEEDTNEKISHSQEANTVESRPVAIVQEKTMNPVELVMALINSKAAMSQQDMINLNNDATAYTISKKSDGTEINVGVDENNASGKNITVLSSVLISSGKPQTRPNQVLSTSPPKLPTSRQNGGTGAPNDDIAFAGDPESPYSPDSGDFDDLFEPPPPDNSISLAQLAHNRKSNKADIFDNLFGSTSPGGQVRMPSFSRRKGNKSKRTRVAKTNDDQVKIFDELPSSAVELQVKDKFLRKLNRQERVVEEVKLVLKPHYNRKRISKEDYKEILRRSVPKICHSRSGEINPAKIKNLIEAYVKKFRQRNKLNMIGTGQVSSAVKCAAYLKKL